MRGRWTKLLLTLMLLAGGCLDPYYPPVSDTDVNILVVDGFLDTSEGSATLSLSKAVSLSSEAAPAAESYAVVTLLDDKGGAYPMPEHATGQYRVDNVPIDPKALYRVHIVTQAGYEYQSDLSAIYDTPPIDSVTWTTDDRNLTVRVNTHDFTNTSRYFRWTYEETWNYHAATLSEYISEGRGAYRSRTPSEMIFYCWATQPSTSIAIGSTVRLSENIVSQAPVAYIPKGSQKLSMKYSILVSQRAVSEAEYTYLEQLKKTTESIGGLFDPQPSQVPGNIHRMSSSSPVAIGYFGVGNTVKERIFIAYTDLPRYFQDIQLVPGCMPTDTICLFPTMAIRNCILMASDMTEATMIGSAVYLQRTLIGLTLTSPRCADCRYDGGVTTKPEFWQ